MSFGIYLTGFVVVIAGLIYGASLMHVPTHWIVVGGLVLVGDRNSDGGQSHSSKRLRNVRPRKGRGFSSFFPGTPEEIQNEMELDIWRSVRSRSHHPRAGPDFGVYRTSAPAGPVRTPWAGYLVRATPGSMATGRRKEVAIVGAGALGPSALSRGALGPSQLSSPAPGLAVT